MIRVTAMILIALTLAACGADGEPIQPTANVNVGVSSSGASAGAAVSIGKGPWNILLGVGT